MYASEAMYRVAHSICDNFAERCTSVLIAQQQLRN